MMKNRNPIYQVEGIRFKFQCFGCPAASSSGSALTRIAIGKTLEAAKEIDEQDILNELGGLPEAKLHCPKLAVTALRKAVARYEKQKRKST
jgi:NifU-like protein involved in Fe-S cluster formation